MTPTPLPASTREGDVLHDDALVARRHDADALDRQPLRRRLQQGLRVRRRHLLQQLVEAVPALARGDKTLPVRDRQIDRRQRPRAQDRARDDDAGGGFLVDHEIGADREHGRLQHHAQDFCDRAEAAGDVAGALIARQIGFVGLAPALGQASGHAHRDQHFGVAPAGGGQIVAPRRQRHRLAGRRARHELGDQRQRHQNDGADQRGDAEQPVEGKADRQIERQPRQIEERARPHAAEERADIVEIAQRLQALVAAADHQRQPHDGLEHAGVDGFVERGSDPAENASAEQVEHALGDVQSAGENDQADQGRHAAARQHPVVDLQHEDRAGQVQQVDHATHDADADEGVAAGAQRFTEFGTPDAGSGCH